MKGLAFRISLIAFLLVFVPTVIFSVYEFSTLKRNEEVVKTIYNNQLDAILFSLNQFSEDVMSSLARELSLDFREDKTNSLISEFLEKYPFIDGIFNIDSVNSSKNYYTRETPESDIPEYILAALNGKTKELNKLFSFYQSNYQKLEPFPVKKNGNLIIVFAISGISQKHLLGFYIQTEKFIDQIFRQKIEQVARERFIICLSDNYKKLVFCTEYKNKQKANAYSKPLWLLPGYEFQIELKGQTIETLIRERSRINLSILIILDITLLLGVLLMFFSIRKETVLNNLKSDFISNVSHEIRTPLALIKMYIETLLLGRVKTEDKKKEYYNIVFEETNRLSGIVNKILSFSKIDSGKQEPRFTKTDLDNMVEKMLESYHYQLTNKGFRCSFVPKGELPEIEADEELLMEALINLLDNSMKYSGETKDISIATGTSNKKVYFRITDKGVGISTADQKYIFDKFYRITEKNLAYKAKGSGLGLTIVKNIVDAHHGQITVKSKVGEGAEFTIYLPINQNVN